MPPGLDEIGMIQQEAGNIGAEALGGIQFFSNLSKEKKDKAELARLHQPFYKIQSELYQNRNMAASMAGQGLPAGTLQYETREAQRGLGSTLDAILRSGGGVNDASLLLSKYNDTIGRIGSEDAAMHNANIRQFMEENAKLAGEKTKAWSINEYQPYEAKLKELKQNIATEDANKWGGLSTAVSSMIGAGQANQNSALMKQLFNNKQSDAGQPPAPYLYTPSIVKGMGGGVTSPAAGVTSINPNIPSPIQFTDTSDNY